MLSLDRICKTYRVGTFGSRELQAVCDVSFDVGTGEVVSVIGESGCGKTTIGKMILRLVSTTSGTITLDGMDVGSLKRRELKEYYRRVQGVFQDPFSSYNPVFKADRVFRIVRTHFYPRIDEQAWSAKVEQALGSVGLNPKHVLAKYPHQLSGGQLQRFLIARALLLDIRFLVADEIISMLDASTRIDVLNLLADLKETGLSVLFVTHDLSLGYYISEHSVILYRGRIVEMGDTRKIFDAPRHPYTRMLMASVPRLDRRWESVDVELQAKEADLTDGCVYYDRCTDNARGEACCTCRPSLVEVAPDHFVACGKTG